MARRAGRTHAAALGRRYPFSRAMPTSILSADECLVISASAPTTLSDEFRVALGEDAPLSDSAAAALSSWLVPRETEGGACSSKPGDTLPFDALRGEYGVFSTPKAPWSPRLRRLARLAGLLRAVNAAASCDWLGVYRVVERGGVRTLQKEAYLGAASRAFFPLTPEFATHSNNSQVGLSGSARQIGDAHALGEDDAYYVCDGRVRSELCAPILAGGVAGGEVIGIVDAESFVAGHFDRAPVAAAAVLLACRLLGEAYLLRDMLADEEAQ